jgi:hypothetical protein
MQRSAIRVWHHAHALPDFAALHPGYDRSFVTAGLDPAIHLKNAFLRRLMDARVKPGHDELGFDSRATILRRRPGSDENVKSRTTCDSSSLSSPSRAMLFVGAR